MGKPSKVPLQCYSSLDSEARFYVAGPNLSIIDSTPIRFVGWEQGMINLVLLETMAATIC